MIKSIDDKPVRDKQEIDLTGPDGNAYVLLGYAKRYARALDMDADVVCDDMMSGDYEHLLSVFDGHFGHMVNMYR